MTFQFKATKEQIRQIGANAIDYSRPMGFGYLHYRSDQFIRTEDIELEDGNLNLDYVAGRCVKLFIRNIGDDTWEIPESPTPDHQTWVRRYPTNESLVESVVKGDHLQNFPSENFDL